MIEAPGVPASPAALLPSGPYGELGPLATVERSAATATERTSSAAARRSRTRTMEHIGPQNGHCAPAGPWIASTGPCRSVPLAQYNGLVFRQPARSHTAWCLLSRCAFHGAAVANRVLTRSVLPDGRVQRRESRALSVRRRAIYLDRVTRDVHERDRRHEKTQGFLISFSWQAINWSDSTWVRAAAARRLPSPCARQIKRFQPVTDADVGAKMSRHRLPRQRSVARTH
jgi:hypothetical protein